MTRGDERSPSTATLTPGHEGREATNESRGVGCSGPEKGQGPVMRVKPRYLESAQLIERGWYLGPLNHRARTLGSIYLPTLLWTWWMRPTASQPVWAYLAKAVEDRDAVVQNGTRALERLAWHMQRLGDLASDSDPDYAFVVESVRYLHDAVTLAQALRTFMLGWFGAAAERKRPDMAAAVGAAGAVRAVLDRQRAAWCGNADFPPPKQPTSRRDG